LLSFEPKLFSNQLAKAILDFWKYLIIVAIPPSLHLAITLKAKLRVAPLVTDVCLCLYVHLEMGFGHFIPVFAQIVGIEELY